MKKTKMVIKRDDIFNSTPREITGGLEVEIYLAEPTSGGGFRLLNGDSGNKMMNHLLDKLPKNVWKDHYPYQLEIKTSPHSSADGLLKDFMTTFQKCIDVTHELGLIMLPISYTGSNGQYNGVHFHVRAKGEEQNFHNTLINTYPHLISIASFFRDCPDGLNILSKRMANSPHIGLPFFDKEEFIMGGSNESGEVHNTGSRKYRDVIINKNLSKNFENKRERSKSVTTFEIRMFDVPTKDNYLYSMIHLLYKLFEHIKTDEPFTKNIWNPVEYKSLAKKTREECIYVRRPFNFFYNTLSNNVVKKLSTWFDVECPDEPFPIVRDARNVQCYNIVRNPLAIDKEYRFVILPDKKTFGSKRCDIEMTRNEKVESIIKIIMENIPRSKITNPLDDRAISVVKELWRRRHTSVRMFTQTMLNDGVNTILSNGGIAERIVRRPRFIEPVNIDSTWSRSEEGAL